MDTIHELNEKFICLKGAEIYFFKLFVLYELKTKIILDQL